MFGCLAFQMSKAMALTAVNCMVDILSSLNHFNYRTNLIVAVVSKVNFVGDRSEVHVYFLPFVTMQKICYHLYYHLSVNR